MQQDNTVSGGTGWAAELARHFQKLLAVFDQDRKVWLEWSEGAWQTLDAPPIIKRRRFAGTGTRFLTEAGQQAIDDLFENSFGKGV